MSWIVTRWVQIYFSFIYFCHHSQFYWSKNIIWKGLTSGYPGINLMYVWVYEVIIKTLFTPKQESCDCDMWFWSCSLWCCGVRHWACCGLYSAWWHVRLSVCLSHTHMAVTWQKKYKTHTKADGIKTKINRIMDLINNSSIE